MKGRLPVYGNVDPPGGPGDFALFIQAKYDISEFFVIQSRFFPDQRKRDPFGGSTDDVQYDVRSLYGRDFCAFPGIRAARRPFDDPFFVGLIDDIADFNGVQPGPFAQRGLCGFGLGSEGLLAYF